MKKLTEKALRYQANACETAKGPRCQCQCHGAFHGIHHSDAWVAETVKKVNEEPERKRAVRRMVERVMKQLDPRQTDWVGYDEFEQFI